jgi:hypothetical protein
MSLVLAVSAMGYSVTVFQRHALSLSAKGFPKIKQGKKVGICNGKYVVVPIFKCTISTLV